MNWKNYNDLTNDVTSWLDVLPKFDLVVAVPRSGLIPATILALSWNVPIATFVDGEVKRTGSGLRLMGHKKIKSVLVVDDSYNYGGAMAEAREIVSKVYPQAKYAAVYGRVDHDLDYCYELIAQPRAFQWNWQHHKELVRTTMFDIDGCLCIKPTAEQNDDGEKYREFILNTPPRYLPSYPLGIICTSRLERFRPETEQWLKKHGVKYDHLLMLNYPSGQFRRRMGQHGYHKGFNYQMSNCGFFVEDEPWQAEQIHKKSGKPVLCVKDWKVIK